MLLGSSRQPMIAQQGREENRFATKRFTMNFFPTTVHWGAMSLVLTCLLSFFYNETVTELQPGAGVFRLRGGLGSRGVGPDPLLTDDSYYADEPSFDPAVPECARDVFLELREEEDGDDDGAGGGDGRGCRGLLVRDDILLTSRECSERGFAFDFPGRAHPRRATPFRLTADFRRLVDPRLGFLRTNAPSHYHFVDDVAMQSRMFLSLESSPNGFEDGDAFLTCEDGRPVAHGFPVDGDLVPLGHLFDVLPDHALWKERDMETAVMLEDLKGRRWWTRPVSREEEESAFQRLIESYTGPPGSVSLPDAHSKYESKVGALCEAIDPRGHRNFDCFKNYFQRWRYARPFSGMRFFDWLDYGPGRGLIDRNDTAEMIRHAETDDKCRYSHFDGKNVHYFKDDERAAHEVYLTPSGDGTEVIARYVNSDEPVVPSYDDDFLYMWDLDERFYVVDHTLEEEYKYIKHTSILAGRPALSAGKASFGEGGRLTGVNWASGHYRPKMKNMALLYRWMKDGGLNVTALNWVGRTSWSTEKCQTYDWEEVRIPGYDGAALNRSCHEATLGPTWTKKEDDR